MNSPTMAEALERAVAPNLFDALADPDLVRVLLAANLMSDRLWDLAGRLEIAEDGAGLLEPQRIQRAIDRHFTHVTTERMAEMNGVLDLELEDRRLGGGVVAYAIHRIRSTTDLRIARGTLLPQNTLMELIERGRFPAYVYATIDEAWAERRLLDTRKHKPLGVTCCLDEVALFCALMLTRPDRDADDIAIAGSPAHYTAFVWSADGPWWFYGKNTLHHAAGWASHVASDHGGDAQQAFDGHLPNMDRYLDVHGHWTFADGMASLDAPRREAAVAHLDRFFGQRLRQVESGLSLPVRMTPPPDGVALLHDLGHAEGAAEVRARVRAAAGHDDALALRALYAYRTVDVPDPVLYLRAGLRGSRLRERAADITDLGGALAAVAAIPGTDSPFLDRDRIALPDEVLRFGTGTDRDRAILLHALLWKGPGDNAGLRTVFTAQGSYLLADGRCIDAATGQDVAAPQGDPLAVMTLDQTGG